MAEPVTANKGLTTPNTGDLVNTWGPILNENFTLLDAFLSATSALTISSGGYSVSNSQAQAARISLTGVLTGNVTLTIPQKAGYFYFHDLTTRGGFAITVTTAANGARSQNLPAKLSHLFSDGANVWLMSEPSHGELKPHGSFTTPPLWLPAAGQSVDRTAYADLFAALGFSTTGTIASGSTSITSVAALPLGLKGSAPYAVPIEGPGIPAGTVMTTFSQSGGSITLSISKAATGSTSGATITLLPHGQGDGSTTFNVPDMRGRAAFGMDGLGGNSAARLTAVSLGDGVTLGKGGGDERLQQHAHNDAGHAHSDAGHGHTDSGHAHSDAGHGHGAGDSGHGHGAGDHGHTHDPAVELSAGGFAYLGNGSTLFSGGGAGSFGNGGTGFPTATGYGSIYVNTGYASIYINTGYANIQAGYAAITTGYANIQTGHANIQNAGGGVAQNLPPALVTNYIIYAGV